MALPGLFCLSFFSKYFPIAVCVVTHLMQVCIFEIEISYIQLSLFKNNNRDICF